MAVNDLHHTHVFETDLTTAAERRTRWVVALTASMMVVEVVAGIGTHSVSLQADGWHMATHAAALGIAVFAYAYARRHASDPRYSFGTGKVTSLGGFASAAALGVVALMVVGESVLRWMAPVAIRYDEAILVAAVGLAVNLVSLVFLRGGHHEHGRHDGPHHHPDHNLRGVYLHVFADVLTSLLAIGALIAGKLAGWVWVDPAVGILAAVLIARWSVRLMRDTSGVLLDAEPLDVEREAIRAAIEEDGRHEVTDLHLWRVGPHHISAILVVRSAEPHSVDAYKARLRSFDELAHLTIEVHADPEITSPRSS
jgi:cation diffusion facilitator family transporter